MNKLIFVSLLSIPAMVFCCGGNSNYNPGGPNYNYSSIPKVENNYFEKGDAQDPQQQAQPQTQAQPMTAQPEAAPTPDNNLRNQIRDRLAGGWFGKAFEGVNIDVNNGVVTITGFVLNDQDKQDVENRIRQLPLVKEVINQLQVRAAAAQQQNQPATTNY